MKFSKILNIIWGVLALILGVLLISVGQALFGLICLVAGVFVGVISVRSYLAWSKGQEAMKQQQERAQNMEQTVATSQPITVTVKVNEALQRGKFSVYCNGALVGNVCIGEVLKFETAQAMNFVQVGKLNKKPFKWPESTCSFTASQAGESVELEITIVGLLITLNNVTTA
ncbi:MAG: hypothetical protein FWF45_05075 [Coriobacteriia bacterium]|nr:hypothetical protein [Coriobacteriia bacterium]